MVLAVVGLVALLGGGEALVRGASGLARRLGVPPLIVGLTVVAFGTSAPEVAVSVMAAARGRGDLAVGNVVGSNVLNVLLILGLAALVAVLAVSPQLVRVDVPFLIAVSLLAWALAADGALARGEGLFLLALLGGYLVLLVRLAASWQPSVPLPAAGQSLPLQLLLVAGGIAMLVIGSRWMLEGAVALARALGVSELVIGLTVVAVGTSLPEVAASVVAAVRGARDIAVGNIVGSNIFNTLGVLGAAALAAPDGLPISAGVLRFDMPVMVAVAVACLPIFFTGHRIDRWEGGVFLAYYLAYTVFLFLDASAHEAAERFGTVMVAFVVPLTAVTLAVLALRALPWRRW